VVSVAFLLVSSVCRGAAASGIRLTRAPSRISVRAPARTIRTEGGKYAARHPEGSFDRYDTTTATQERFNFFRRPARADDQRTPAAQLDTFSQRHADPQYDVRKTGLSKAGALK